jgi:type IV pilus assembly protein PilC
MNSDTRLRNAFAAIAEDIKNGNTLSSGMAKCPNVFSKLDTSLIEAGERSGELSACAKQLAAWYDFRNRVRSTIRTGLVRPVLVYHVAAVLAAIPWVFLRHLDVRYAMIAVVVLLGLFWVPAIFILAIVKFSREGSPARLRLDRLVWYTPILKRAFRCLALARYSRAFYILYKAGLPITECARRSVELSGNAYFAQQMRGTVEATKTGRPVSEGFPKSLPAEFVDAWVIGEETGKLDEAVGRLTQQSEYRCQVVFTEISNWLPRFLYVLIGAFMAYSAISGWQMIINFMRQQ